METKKPDTVERFKIRIDKENYDVHQPTITGREILDLAEHKTPEKYKLYQYKTEPHGQQRVEIDADHVVDLREPGVERFSTLLREAIDG